MSRRRAVLSGQHYSNIKMISPEGVLMCRLSERRAQWYLDRGLATSDGTGSIRLTFTPNGLGANGHTFYTSAHLDICVVCGRTEALSRHHCVPHCFRKHFPDEYKVHNWHDIVLLCDDCHNGYEEVAQLVKNDMLQIPEEEWQQRKDKLRAIKNAHTLVYHLDLIPESKKEHIRASLSEYLGVDRITDDQIIELALQDRPCLLTDEDWKRVVDNVEDLDVFVRWWRQHFLDTMTPEYLPQGWSVDSPTTRHDLDIVSGRITV